MASAILCTNASTAVVAPSIALTEQWHRRGSKNGAETSGDGEQHQQLVAILSRPGGASSVLVAPKPFFSPAENDENRVLPNSGIKDERRSSGGDLAPPPQEGNDDYCDEILCDQDNLATSAAFHPDRPNVLLVGTKANYVYLYHLVADSASAAAGGAITYQPILSLSFPRARYPVSRFSWFRLSEQSFWTYHAPTATILLWNLGLLRAVATRSQNWRLCVQSSLIGECARKFQLLAPKHRILPALSSSPDTATRHHPMLAPLPEILLESRASCAASKKLSFLVRNDNMLYFADALRNGQVLCEITLPAQFAVAGSSVNQSRPLNHTMSITREPKRSSITVSEYDDTDNDCNVIQRWGGMSCSASFSKETTTHFSPLTTVDATAAAATISLTTLPRRGNHCRRQQCGAATVERPPTFTRTIELVYEEHRYAALLAPSGISILLIDLDWERQQMARRCFFELLYEKLHPARSSSPQGSIEESPPLPTGVVDGSLSACGSTAIWHVVTATETVCFQLILGSADARLPRLYVLKKDIPWKKGCRSPHSAALLNEDCLIYVDETCDSICSVKLSQTPSVPYLMSSTGKEEPQKSSPPSGEKTSRKAAAAVQVAPHQSASSVSTSATSSPMGRQLQLERYSAAEASADKSLTPAESFLQSILDLMAQQQQQMCKRQEAAADEALANNPLGKFGSQIVNEIKCATVAIDKLSCLVHQLQSQVANILHCQNVLASAAATSYSTLAVAQQHHGFQQFPHTGSQQQLSAQKAAVLPQRAALRLDRSALEQQFWSGFSRARGGIVGWGVPWQAALAHDCLTATPASERRALRALCLELQSPESMGNDWHRLDVRQLLSSAGVLATCLLEQLDWRDEDEVELISNWICELALAAQRLSSAYDDVPDVTRAALVDTLQAGQVWARNLGFETARRHLEIARNVVKARLTTTTNIVC